MLEIIKNYRDNLRYVHEEPSIEIYDKNFLKTWYGSEVLNHSDGKEFARTQYIIDLCPLQPSYAALDVGCGRGDLVLALGQLGLSYVAGIDLSEDCISCAKAGCAQAIANNQVTIQKMDATALEFDHAFFDVVYMTDIVEHLSNASLKKAFSEAHRVLKPGGKLIIHTYPTVNYKLYGQYLVKYYLRLKGISWWTLTRKEEAGICGHVNIQSKSSLESYLHQSFEAKKTKVFYAPVHSDGVLKKLISLFGFWRIISPYLWAIATK